MALSTRSSGLAVEAAAEPLLVLVVAAFLAGGALLGAGAGPEAAEVAVAAGAGEGDASLVRLAEQIRVVRYSISKL